MIKREHPNIPVIFGGLSATYFHRELIEMFPQVDYVVRGDSCEVPILKLMESIEQGKSIDKVPNLTSRNNGKVQVNPLSYVPDTLKDFKLDYGKIVKSIIKSFDLIGHVPSKRWLDYPITAILTCKGCTYNCITCGGSKSAYALSCGRFSPAFKSPERIVEEIQTIEDYLDAPIFLIGDLRQGGKSFAYEVLRCIKKANVNNPIIFELFSPASRNFLEMMTGACTPQNLEISPESHDEHIRQIQGRPYLNKDLEKTLYNALNLGFKKVDVFFMIGLAHQTFNSVMETVKYCGGLLKKFGKNKRLHPFISPLAPFLDVGSPAFESPEKFGYEKLYLTLKEHKEALTAPCWKYFLNYKTRWMDRNDIVESTYEAAFRLNETKKKFNLISEKESEILKNRIILAKEISSKIQDIVENTKGQEKEKALNSLREDMRSTSEELLCPKRELQIPYSTHFKKKGILKALLGR
jgi:B12-binding domain/radical SAM domain protein